MNQSYQGGKKSSDVLIDFCNLQIEPDFSNSTGKILDERDKEHVIHFLDKWLKIIIKNPDTRDLKSGDVLESQIFLLPIPSATSPSVTNLLLERYQRENNTNWFESADFKGFIETYQMARRTIGDLVSNRYYSYIEDWLQSLWAELEEIELEDRSKIIQSKGKLFKMRPISAPHSTDSEEVYWNLGNFEYFHLINVSYRLNWCGLSIHIIGKAIFEGFTDILKKKVILKRCKLPNCNKIFVVSNRGRYEHKFCDENCRKREKKRPYYEELAEWIAEWLQTKDENEEYVDSGYAHKAREIDEYLGAFVRQKYDSEFSVTSHQVGVEFKILNPYLLKHGFKCVRERKRNQCLYTFERI